MPTPAAPPSLGRKLLFSCLITLALLALAETVAQWCRARWPLEWRGEVRWQSSAFPDKEPAYRIFRDELHIQDVPDAILMHHARPGQRATTFHINSRGLRGPEPAVPRPAGLVRVLLLGGSVVWGTGASGDDATIAACLQRELARRWQPARVEVINAGYLGYASCQESLLYQLHADDLRPDVVVTLGGFNDFREAMMRGLANAHDCSLAAARQAAASRQAEVFGLRPTLRRWLRNSAIVDGIYMQLASRGFVRPWPTHTDPVLVARAVSIWRRNLTALATIARQRNTPCFFALQPALGVGHKALTAEEQEAARREARRWTQDPIASLRLYFDAARQQLPALATESRCVAADLTDVFDAEARTIYVDPCHTGDDGHALIARRLAEVVAAGFSPAAK
ncbi:MAG: SGNH/GDSL hydrolase family protein [Verrucomicrobia bacterium]|nr:SGNH/GDSL hydrolase family protein [Verrucomicrobiota bacterium]